jgi:hypothetical protein
MPNQAIVATIEVPLNPPILGDFKPSWLRSPPELGGWGAVRQDVLHQFSDLVLNGGFDRD